jgi:hypothetical protein
VRIIDWIARLASDTAYMPSRSTATAIANAASRT